MSRDIKDLVIGKWKGTLATLGVPDQFLHNKHGPCPLCGGKDRYRFDNRDGRGTYYCNQCGAGDGWDLLMQYNGWSFKDTAGAVREALGEVQSDPVRKKSTRDTREWCRRLWEASHPVKLGDEVDRYLSGRGLGEQFYPEALRTCERCWFGKDSAGHDIFYPAMIAQVTDVEGKSVTLHRTYLHNGKQAPVDTPKKLMPGSLPLGSAVRLGPVALTMGIAEGIETALAASAIFDMPVWAALNARNLSVWDPPVQVEKLVIFGDNDTSMTGQHAAFGLAKKLREKGVDVEVMIPDRTDTDWADELQCKIPPRTSVQPQ